MRSTICFSNRTEMNGWLEKNHTAKIIGYSVVVNPNVVGFLHFIVYERNISTRRKS